MDQTRPEGIGISHHIIETNEKLPTSSCGLNGSSDMAIEVDPVGSNASYIETISNEMFRKCRVATSKPPEPSGWRLPNVLDDAVVPDNPNVDCDNHPSSSSSSSPNWSVFMS